MDEITSLKNQIVDLNGENLKLKNDVSYLKGKVGAYEWFLKKQGFIKGDKE